MSQPKYRAVGDRLVARMHPEEEVKVGGIILTGKSADDQMNMRRAVVVSSNIEGVNEGDTVLYNKMFGTVFLDHVILDSTDAFVVEEQK